MTTTVQRGFYHGLYQIPQLINIFVPPIVAQSLVNQGQWRWGYGHLPIVLLVGNLPLVCGLWRTQFKVFKRGLYDEYKQAKRERDSHRSLWQSIRFYLVAIDLVGCILLVGGLTMILLPLVLALSTWGGWTNCKFILRIACTQVFAETRKIARTLGSLCGGVVAWVLFFVWEWKFAENPLVPMMNWPNKTPLWGVCATSTVTIISSTNWQYFSSYLMVSRKIDSQTATWMQRGYNVAYLIVQLLVGYLMMRTRVWRPYVWVGIALMILGVGLMIPARLPSSSDAFVVISQAIAGVGSGMMDIPITVAIQSSVPHNDLAMVTSLYQLGGSIAASIGSTMAGAIWNQMLPGQLAKYVPGQYDQEEIMGDIFYATSLPDDQYQGVVEAYGETQKVLSIISVCISILTFAFTIPMKGFGLSDNNQKEDKPEQKESGLDGKSVATWYLLQQLAYTQCAVLYLENSTKNQVPVAKH